MFGFIMARVGLVALLVLGLWVFPLAAMYIFAPR